MTTLLSLQHDEWHRIFGRYTNCPLDCNAREVVVQTFEEEWEALHAPGARSIRCAACKGRHASVDTVKFCHEVTQEDTKFDRDQAALAKELEEAGECEHGLSKALCAGPNHYPADNYDD